MDRRSVALAFLSRGALVALLVALAPALARADRHKAGFGGGAAYDARSALWGIRMTGDWTLKEGPTSNHGGASHKAWMISAAGELSQVAGSHEGSNLSQTTFLVGPRYTWNQIGSSWRFELFGEALIGLAYERSLETHTGAAGSFGIGLDVPLGTLTDTEHHPLVVLRGQYGRHWINEDSTDWYNQYALSVVFRLTRKR
jgi:hypothetical protein